MSSYYDKNGKPYELQDAPLGKGGGEGAVYAIKGMTGLVAKIYHVKPDLQRREKIEAQASLKSPGSHCAWPLTALYDDANRTSLVGFTMRRCQATKNIGDLYQYPGPAVNMRQKLQVVRSLAVATEEVHRASQVVGDYNDKNVILAPGCGVVLIDCDSFDVVANGSHYPCTVCMTGYVAPEILRKVKGSGKTYEQLSQGEGRLFTKETDDWALAVHVFRMLMNGLHPYHCAAMPNKNGSVPAPLSVDKRVERGETPFFKKVKGVSQAKFAPDIASLPPYLVDAFKRAFVDGHSAPSSRPKAEEWVRLIDRYLGELKICSANESHGHWRGAASCPYCAADKFASSVQGKLQGAAASFASKAPARPMVAIAAPSTPTASGSKKGCTGNVPPQAPTKRWWLQRTANKGPLSEPEFWGISAALALILGVAFAMTPPAVGIFTMLFGGYNQVAAVIVMTLFALLGAFVYNVFRADGSGGRLAGSCAAATAGVAISVPVSWVILLVLQFVVAFAAVALVLLGLIAVALDL